MTIIVSVVTYCGEAPEQPIAGRFDQLGGALGRAAGNELVLDDPGKYISRVHARIDYADGAYYLLDVGSNPSLVNERPLGQGKRLRLADQDRIVIGDYQLLVSMAPAVAIPALPPSPLQAPAAVAPAAPLPFNVDDSLAGAGILSGGPLSGGDPLGLGWLEQPSGAAAQPAAGPAYRGAESDHAAPQHASFQMPVRAAAPMAIPDDYDPLADSVPAPAKAPAPTPAPAPDLTEVSAPAPRPAAPAVAAPPAPVAVASPAPAVATPASGGDGAVFQALLRGLGMVELNSKRTPEEIAELAGAMLREATGGTMGVLMARAMTKRESRLDMTMIAAQANNPLKFFPDAGAALQQMIGGGMPGYMGPARAFASAFEDLRAHELAVMAGTRAALNGVLARFDPAAIEQRMAAPSALDRMMTDKRKARMWEQLVALHQQLAHEVQDDFQRLFGDSFGAAYQQQIDRLQPPR